MGWSGVAAAPGARVAVGCGGAGFLAGFEAKPG